nr:hypothetical protein TR92_01490 [Brucella anthropi]
MTSDFTLGTDQYKFDEYRKRLQLAVAIAGYFTSGGKAENVFATADAAVIDNNNNAVPLRVWGIIAFAGGYATYEGDGNSAEGLRVIGRGESLAQALAAAGVEQAVALVIPPFLAGLCSRIHAAIFSFCAGVDAHIGPFVVVGPEPLRGEFLCLLDTFDGVLVKPFMSHGAIVALDIGILLRFSGLDVA